MKIIITFTENEKRAIKSFAEAVGDNPEEVFAKAEHNDTTDQIQIEDLDNGGILCVDEELTCKVVKFFERKASSIKVMTSFLKSSIEEFSELITKNTTNRKKMASMCKEIYERNESIKHLIENVVCVRYKSGHMETRAIFKDEACDTFFFEDGDIIEAVLCDEYGVVTDVVAEVEDFIKNHNKVAEEIDRKVTIEEETYEDSLLLRRRETGDDLDKEILHKALSAFKASGDRMRACLCTVTNVDEPAIDIRGIYEDSFFHLNMAKAFATNDRVVLVTNDGDEGDFIRNHNEIAEYIKKHNMYYAK